MRPDTGLGAGDMYVSDGEIATNVTATAGVTSPLWLPSLQSTSAVFAELWPILGGIWLFVQIVRALIVGYVAYRTWCKKNRSKV